MIRNFQTIGRFLAAGTINTIASYAIFVVLNAFIPYAFAFSVAFVCGIALSFFLSSYFVFDRQPTVKAAVVFPFVYLFQYAATMLGLYVLIEIGSLKEWAALLIMLAVTTPITFILSRLAITRLSGQFSERRAARSTSRP